MIKNDHGHYFHYMTDIYRCQHFSIGDGSMRKHISQQEKSEHTKQLIYESADYLFREFGSENVSVNAIVDRANVSKGSFYVHYASKDALIAEVIEKGVKALDLNYSRYVQSLPPDMPAYTMLLLLAEKSVDFMADVGYDNIKFVYTAQLTRSIKTHHVTNYTRDIYTIVLEILKCGVEQGEFKKEVDAEEIANYYVLGIRGIAYEWCIRYPDFDFKRTVRRHMELFLAGILNCV